MENHLEAFKRPIRIGSLGSANTLALLLMAGAETSAKEAEKVKSDLKAQKDNLTREDFPSRQAWRNHLRQKAKGYNYDR